MRLYSLSFLEPDLDAGNKHAQLVLLKEAGERLEGLTKQHVCELEYWS